MRQFQITFFSFTFWKLIYGCFLDCVGLPMARVTEMGVAPAEPNGPIATVLTLELYVVCPVRRTVCYTTTYRVGSTLRTLKSFLIEIVHVELGLLGTVFATNEIGILTFEALIIGQRAHRKSKQVAVIRIFRIQELFIFLQVIVISSLHCFVLNNLFELELLLEFFVQLLGSGARNFTLALRTVEMVENDSCAVPTLADLLYHTIMMDYVITV